MDNAGLISACGTLLTGVGGVVMAIVAIRLNTRREQEQCQQRLEDRLDETRTRLAICEQERAELLRWVK
jgi:hypothetical protein